MFFLTHYCRI